MKKKILLRAVIGFFLGILIGLVISWLTGDPLKLDMPSQLVERVGSQSTALALHIVLSGLYGAVCMGGTLFYDIERWPLALSSAVHCGVILALYIPIALFLHWVGSPADLFLSVGIQIVCYFIIWLILFLIYRHQVKELNDLQHQNHTEEKRKV